MRRRRRTAAEVDAFEAEIIRILRADHPQSVRHVFYRLTDPALGAAGVEKTERGYDQVVRRLVKMRKAGRLPYDWLTDSTRLGFHVATYANAAEFLRSVQGDYRAAIWTEADVVCEVWTESRSIAGVLRKDCEEMAVSLYPCGGFSSLSQTYEAAQGIRWECNDGGKTDVVIVYAGDFDPAGVLIDQDVKAKLREHLQPRGIYVHMRRVAVNEDQIAAMNLPTKPRKASERRRRDILETVEVEAMPAGVLRGLVRAEVEALLPPDALRKAKLVEEEERGSIIDMADYLEEVA